MNIGYRKTEKFDIGTPLIHLYKNYLYGDSSIRVYQVLHLQITIIVSVLLEYINYF